MGSWRTHASCWGSGGRSGFRAAGDGVPPRYLLSTHSATRLAARAAECACRDVQMQHSIPREAPSGALRSFAMSHDAT